MPSWVRKGDINSVGAPIESNVAQTVFVNGKPAALKNSVVATHNLPPIHKKPTVIQGSSTVIVESRPPAFVGAMESCGHKQMQGSPNVFIPGL